MDEQRQDDQLEPIYKSSVPIQDVTLKTYRVAIEGQGESCWRCDMMMMTTYNKSFILTFWKEYLKRFDVSSKEYVYNRKF